MRHLFSILFLCLVISCSGEKTNFTVTCSLNEPVERQLYLARLTLTGKVVTDSAIADNKGVFHLSGYTDLADFFIVYFDPDHYLNLIIKPGDKIKVDARLPAFEQDYSVEGSSDSRLIQRMITRQTITLKRITDISEEYENSIGKPDFQAIKDRIDSAYDQIIEEHRQFSIDLIEENTTSLAALMTLYQQLGRNTPVFDYRKDFYYYRLVDSVLTIQYPGSEAVRDLNRKVTGLKEDLKVETGVVAPDIVMPDQTGEQVSLSSLRGKYVLLFFGASWSDESNRQARILSEMYAKLKGQGVEYYQVSLDRTKESWINGISENKAQGIQVCDEKYWDSPVVEDYRIETVPRLFLLDREGVIIDRDFSAESFTDRFYELAGIEQ